MVVDVVGSVGAASISALVVVGAVGVGSGVLFFSGSNNFSQASGVRCGT